MEKTKIDVQPLNDDVVLQRVNLNDLYTRSVLTVPSGVITQIPDTQGFFVVIAVGPGRDLGNGNTRMPSVAVGDVVMMPVSRGEIFVINNKQFLLVNNGDIRIVCSRSAFNEEGSGS